MKNLVAGMMLGLKDKVNSRAWPDRPQGLMVEITSICDSKCIHCPREAMDRPMRAMDLGLFRRLVDQAAELGIPEFYPNGFGELMTVKDPSPYLEYLNSKEHKFRIILNTNAFRMTEEKIEALIRNRVYLLNICIDGATAEVTEKIRVNLKLAEIEKNILRLMEIRRERGLDYPKVRVGMVVLPQNRHEVEAFRAKWAGKVDFVGVDGYSNRAGSLTEKFGQPGDAPAGPPARTCILPFKELNVWSDGKAVICCNDWNEEHVIGDVGSQSLREIWQGEAARKVRELHASGRGDELAICAKCNYWKAPSWGANVWVDR